MTEGPGFVAANLLDDGEEVVERSLRPRSLDEYLGQREVKAGLGVLLQAARQRGEAADHVLLHGPPGLGKTTLATVIARELGVNIRDTSGPAVERAGDLAAILTGLDDRDGPSSSTRSTASTGPSRRSSTRRWRTSRST